MNSDIQAGQQQSAAEPGLDVHWDGVVPVTEWLENKPIKSWKAEFDQTGILKIESLISEAELQIYSDLYDKLLSGEKVDVSTHRHDLGNHVDRLTSVENICQIMWPSIFVQGLDQGPLHQRCVAVARILLGDDMDFDFDMLISKSAQTSTETPWHQDESYWVDMPDKRALSFWVAIDRSFVENGCMWFVPQSHRESQLRAHRLVRPGVHVRMCDCAQGEGQPYPLSAAGATVHHGRTVHYSAGNTTDLPRRAFIVNCRPTEMVEYERNMGFDHGRKGLQNIMKFDK